MRLRPTPTKVFIGLRRPPPRALSFGRGGEEERAKQGKQTRQLSSPVWRACALPRAPASALKRRAGHPTRREALGNDMPVRGRDVRMGGLYSCVRQQSGRPRDLVCTVHTVGTNEPRNPLGQIEDALDQRETWLISGQPMGFGQSSVAWCLGNPSANKPIGATPTTALECR